MRMLSLLLMSLVAEARKPERDKYRKESGAGAILHIPTLEYLLTQAYDNCHMFRAEKDAG